MRNPATRPRGEADAAASWDRGSRAGIPPETPPGRPPAPSQSLELSPTGASIAPWVLLPMRFFFGGMFLYAGLDKLLDPAFLRPEGIGSIGEQLHGFVEVSPLAPLITLVALPFPVLVGVGIALLEIAIGIGAITGLLFRPAAFAGLGVSVLFFLTASWDTHPYYLGADLPYALGWLTLLLAGDGGLLSVDAWLRRRDEAAAAAAGSAWTARRRDGNRSGWTRSPGMPGLPPDPADPSATTRRRFLELGILAMASIVVAGIAWRSPFRGQLTDVGVGSSGSASPAGGDLGLTTPPPAASLAPSADATAPGATATPATPSGATPAPASGGTLLGKIDQVPKGQAATFTVPSTGDPGILVRLDSGATVAYDALCTHEGCQVGFDPGQSVLVCPCHGAVFDPAHGAKVLRGPARRPLPELKVRVDQAGNVYLEA